MHVTEKIVLFTGPQRLCAAVRARGFQTAVLQGPGEDLSPRADVDHVIPYRPQDLEQLRQTVRERPYRDRIVCVFNRRELRVREAAVLNEALGFDGITVRQAEIVTDKYLLHEVLREKAPDLCPGFQVLFPGSSLSLQPPVVLKPRNMFKSQLIRFCRTRDEADAAAADFFVRAPSIAQRHGVDLRDGVLAEEYLEGMECALDSFVEPNGTIHHGLLTELTGARSLGLDDFHVYARYSPGRFSDAQRRQAEEAAEGVIEAVGLRNGAAHVDLVLTPRGPKVLELGARIGGYRSEMAELSYGYSLDDTLLNMLLNEPLDLTPRFVRHTAVLEFFPPDLGTLDSIAGLERVEKLASFRRFKVRQKKGDDVGLARHGFRCVVFVELNHEDEAVVRADAERCRELIEVRLER